MTNKERRKQAAILHRRRVLIENSFIPRLKKEMKRMYEQASEDYNVGGRDRVIIGLEEHQKNLANLLEMLYVVCAESSRNYLVDSFGKRGIIKKETKGLSDAFLWVLSTFRKFALAQSTQIAETSKAGIIAVIEDGLNQRDEEGRGVILGPAEIARNIRKTGLEVTKFRTELIARTETGMALNQAQDEIVQGMDSIGQPIKVWNAINNSRTRKDHREVDGVSVPRDGLFTVGRDKMKYPGDRSASAANVCNCRCSVLYLIEGLDL
jgi:hypothetical protein